MLAAPARRAAVVALVGFGLVAPRLAVAQPSAPVEAPVAPPTVEEMARFLREATIVSIRPIGRGVTGARRATLSDGTRTHDASFQAIDVRSREAAQRAGFGTPAEAGFVDSYRYNIAAYAVAGVVGLAYMMPVTVERKVEGALGALTWWVDDVLMDENERENSKTQPPSAIAMHHQRQRMMMFGELVGDMDRNRGNMIYTKDWRLVMIDFTRGFRAHREVRQPEAVQACDRVLFARLQSLRREEIASAAGDWLTPWEIDALMARRDALVAHIRRLIAARGDGVVLY